MLHHALYLPHSNSPTLIAQRGRSHDARGQEDSRPGPAARRAATAAAPHGNRRRLQHELVPHLVRRHGPLAAHGAAGGAEVFHPPVGGVPSARAVAYAPSPAAEG